MSDIRDFLGSVGEWAVFAVVMLLIMLATISTPVILIWVIEWGIYFFQHVIPWPGAH